MVLFRWLWYPKMYSMRRIPADDHNSQEKTFFRLTKRLALLNVIRLGIRLDSVCNHRVCRSLKEDVFLEAIG